MPVLSADVDVELDVVDRNNKPPVWDANVYGPIHIKENVTVGTVVTSVKARFVCHDMTETRHVTCRAVPCSAILLLSVSLSLSLSLFLVYWPSPNLFCLSHLLFLSHSITHVFCLSFYRSLYALGFTFRYTLVSFFLPLLYSVSDPITTFDLIYFYFVHFLVHLYFSL